jgi:integrase
MKVTKGGAQTAPARGQTVQDVMDRLAGSGLSETRKRDLRSAVATYGKTIGQAPAGIALDVSAIRQNLETVVALQGRLSPKRLANLRSDLAAAIAASGLAPMLVTARVKPAQAWEELLGSAGDRNISDGLSRLARWATLRQLGPLDIDGAALGRFFSELETASLVRKLKFLQREIPRLWNKLVVLVPGHGLSPVSVPSNRRSDHVPWRQFAASFKADVDDYLRWCSVPDPLGDRARARALAPKTLRLRRHHLHLAASAACQAGMNIDQLTSMSCLIEPETFQSILRHQWNKHHGRPSPYLTFVAGTLIRMAAEWVKAPDDQLAALKKLRGKLGKLPTGLTVKNKATLRRFDDPRLLELLIGLPDRLWRVALGKLMTSKMAFVDVQTALAIDILLHAPMRVENLASLKFGEHLHWPRGRGRTALIVIRGDETKNDQPLEFELPVALSDRLYRYRHELAAGIIGKLPELLFVSANGLPRTLTSVSRSIQGTIRRHLGVHMTPHQFRHLAAKIHLDSHHGSYEVVRQLLGHKSLRTTTSFYAGPDTRRAGRAHADLIGKLRNPTIERRPRRSAVEH